MNLHIAENTDVRTVQTFVDEAKALGLRVVHRPDELDRIKSLSVTNIMLKVVPGFDGMGEEVYAQSVSDVEQAMSELSQDEERARQQRDNAWEELRKIREAIEANPEESTFDEVVKVANQRDALLHALKLARAFIANGIEVGAIRMPDSSTPDQANETLPLIDAIIAKVEAK